MARVIFLCTAKPIIAFAILWIAFVSGSVLFLDWHGALVHLGQHRHNGPIDERGWMSQFFNLIGFFMVAFSVIAIILFVLFTVIAVISIVTFGVQK